MAITQQKALSKVFGDPQKKVLRKLEKRVGAINALAKKYEKMFKKQNHEIVEEITPML